MLIVRKFLACRRGATAIEYGVIAGCIFLVIITAIVPIGPHLTSIFNKVSTNLK